MNLEVITPKGVFLKLNDVSRVIVPATAGEMGILPGHRDGIMALNAGVARAGDRALNLGAGYVQIADDVVRAVVETAAFPEDTSLAEAQ